LPFDNLISQLSVTTNRNLKVDKLFPLDEYNYLIGYRYQFTQLLRKTSLIQSMSKRLKKYSTLISALVITTGIFVLLAWQFDIVISMQTMRGATPMNPMTDQYRAITQ